MAQRFYNALSDALSTTGRSLADVCKSAGVSYDQMKKFMQRAARDEHASTNVDDAVKIAHQFGVTLDEFLRDDSALLRSEAVRLWQQLSDAERRILLAAARGSGADLG